MLISKVPDEDGGKGECPPVDDNSHEYQTANELLDMMAKNQNFSASDGDTLTPRDLVLLYKNIDLGTKLMTSAKDLTCVKTNQHVETVVYHDEPESDGSDISDVYSNEDLQNIFLINKERLDLLNIPSSVENKLCHKFGDLEIQTTDDIDYNRHFLFQDPFIKEQLKSFNVHNNSKEIEASVLPASLLDYVCCKRLEDNYNFYMDNIIRYVKNTIEQLKRISNGDYLTDKAKEKWKEVEHAEETSLTNTKVLATSTSIPLHVECKVGHQTSTWDDLVRSEVDIRSLSKILEKKIFVEVPKCISGSYKLLSKCCDDNLIISCQKEQPIEDSKKESRVDVVFKLKRSETGHVVSNISSIMFLQTTPIAKVLEDARPAEVPLAVLYKEIPDNNECLENNVKITELKEISEINDLEDRTDISEVNVLQETCDANDDNYVNNYNYVNNDNYINNDNCDNNGNDDFGKDDREVIEDDGHSFGSQPKENRRTVSFDTHLHMSDESEFRYHLCNNIDEVQIHTPKEASFQICPADLRMTMQKLTIQNALPEENVEDLSQPLPLKKKSPTRVRIKSPYENKSRAMEEKKRRKLLEIREKREKKKMALAESCKINKNKFGNRAPTPQASSSVTKLSITNKSFYNSIYGHSTDVDFKQAKNRSRRGENQKDNLDVALENLENEEEMPLQELNSKKFINRSYYLDDAVTEMMYLTMKQKEEEKEMISASTSGVSGDFGTNLNILSQLISHSDIEANGDDNDEMADRDEATETTGPLSQAGPSEIKTNLGTRTIESTPKTPNITPRALNVTESNKPKDPDKCEKKDLKKIKPSLECRKSIDKIYKLMNKIGKRPDSDNKSLNKYSGATSHGTDVTADKGSASIQGSDSGTSLKHHLTSSNPSTFSFDRNNNPENSAAFKRSDSPINVTPKVIISSKSQIPVSKSEADKNKRDRNARVPSPTKAQEPNPLKAISQLLHEFENVQRNRLKSGKEQKSAKKDKTDTNQPNTNTVNDCRINARQGAIKRRSRMEQHNEIVDRNTRANAAREKKIRQISGVETPKIPYQQVPTDDRYIDKPNKKKINDILDEAKEARGEAVRGPSKFTSRLNSLAQPKRSYVQAHSAEYQNRYGRNLITDRLQRLAAAPAPPVAERTTTSPNFRNRARRHGNDAVSAVSLKLPHQSSLPIDRPARTRHSTSNSPETKERVSAGIGPSFKPINVAETPETFQKMVEVESYVKNHYGRASSATITIEPFHPAKKSRAPLVPDNIDIGSVSSSPSPQESAEAGSKLHRIIDFMLKNPTCGLEVLAECHEPNSKTPKDNNNDICFSTYRCEEGFSVDSDSVTGTTDDELILRNKKSDAHSLSGMDMEKIKHALCNTISVGTFSKRLRVKNLGLTPKTSIQQLFLLQAGDTGSLVLNATLPENSAQEKLLNLKNMPILSKSNLDWSFTNIPMQITTVGYAFPEYKTTRSGSQSLTQLLEKVSKSSSQKSSLACLKSSDKNPTSNKGVDNIVEKAHKDSQCYRGTHLQPLLEQDSIGDVPSDSAEAKICSKLVPNTVCHNVGPKPRPDSNNDSKVEHPIVEAEKSKTTDERQATSLDDKLESGLTSIAPIEVENTTSFDVLVGLLNEIKKITTCQTHITKNEADECKELEFILNKTAQIENSNQSVAYNGISFTNLENLRCLESNPSVYSLYLSDNEDAEKRKEIDRDINPWYEIKYNISRPKPICVDKEIAVNIPRKECVNRLTDVPSVFFPITINHSTDVTVSPLIAELCQTSKQSLFSYHSSYSDGLSKSMLEIPQALDIKDVDVAVSPCEDNEIVTKINVTKPIERNSRYCGKDKAVIKEVKTPNNVTYSLNNTGFDPVMKMKRDLLVTIYSMLVFTVFAALSFPEVLFHV